MDFLICGAIGFLFGGFTGVAVGIIVAFVFNVLLEI